MFTRKRISKASRLRLWPSSHTEALGPPCPAATSRQPVHRGLSSHHCPGIPHPMSREAESMALPFRPRHAFGGGDKGEKSRETKIVYLTLL